MHTSYVGLNTIEYKFIQAGSSSRPQYSQFTHPQSIILNKETLNKEWTKKEMVRVYLFNSRIKMVLFYCIFKQWLKLLAYVQAQR